MSEPKVGDVIRFTVEGTVREVYDHDIKGVYNLFRVYSEYDSGKGIGTSLLFLDPDGDNWKMVTEAAPPTPVYWPPRPGDLWRVPSTGKLFVAYKYAGPGTLTTYLIDVSNAMTIFSTRDSLDGFLKLGPVLRVPALPEHTQRGGWCLDNYLCICT